MVSKPKAMNLIKGERVLNYTQRSWKSFYYWIIFSLLWLFFGLAVPVLIPLGIFLLLAVIIRKYSSEYAVTNKRVFSRQGFSLGKSINQMKLEDIDKVIVQQGMMAETMNYGDVVMKKLSGVEDVIFRGVDSPRRWRAYILKKKESRGSMKNDTLEVIPPKKDDKKVLKKK